jgi:hypothetical protein
MASSTTASAAITSSALGIHEPANPGGADREQGSIARAVSPDGRIDHRGCWASRPDEPETAGTPNTHMAANIPTGAMRIRQPNLVHVPTVWPTMFPPTQGFDGWKSACDVVSPELVELDAEQPPRVAQSITPATRHPVWPTISPFSGGRERERSDGRGEDHCHAHSRRFPGG